MKILSPFGPRIVKIKFPKILINKINKEIDKIISDKKNLKKNDYSKKLVGQVHQEIELPKKFVDRFLKKFISKNVITYVNMSDEKKYKKIEIKNFWIVTQFKNDYNPVHYHEGDISGVGYLKVPKNLNQSKKKIKTNGTIDFINGTRSFLSKSIYNHLPKVGDLILFPNYLMHIAYPFKVDGERRSFSFNIKMKS